MEEMKCSVGVAVCAVVVLVASALTLVAAGGAAFVFLGPISSQLFDPATLPPGADIRMMRAAGIVGAVTLMAFGSVGVITGIGLFRLWRWARYSMIAFGAFVAVMSAITLAATLWLPMTPAQGGVSVARTVIAALVVFYVVTALVGAWLVYFFTRLSTSEQFGGVWSAERAHRPLSVTVIAWIMIGSGAMMVPSIVLLTLPAVVLGLLVTGVVARLYYALYMLAYLVIGIGLLRRTARALTPAIAMHVFASVNAVSLLIPGVWGRYHAAVAAVSPVVADQPSLPAVQFYSGGLGVLFSAVIIYFLIKARDHVDPLDAIGSSSS